MREYLNIWMKVTKAAWSEPNNITNTIWKIYTDIANYFWKWRVTCEDAEKQKESSVCVTTKGNVWSIQQPKFFFHR